MFDVFRFAWFAVRTFFGAIGVVLVLYVALWLFVKVLSAAPGHSGPDAALNRVKVAQRAGGQSGADNGGRSRWPLGRLP